MEPEGFNRAIWRLRLEAGLGLRELSRKAGVSAATLSSIEKGEGSPTLATLHRVLRALGTDFGEFFSPPPAASGSVFAPEGMRSLRDAHREYVFLLPRRRDIHFEMVLETIASSERRVEWETHDCDVGGVLLSGGPGQLEIAKEGTWRLRRGQAFYIRAGAKHRLRNLGRRPLRQLTVWYPPRY